MLGYEKKQWLGIALGMMETTSYLYFWLSNDLSYMHLLSKCCVAEDVLSSFLQQFHLVFCIGCTYGLLFIPLH